MALNRIVLVLFLALAACASRAQISHVASTSASSCDSGTAPVQQAIGTAQAGTGAASVPWPAHQANDIALLFVETQGADNPATPTGFAAVTGSPQTTGTETRLSVFWRRATGAAMANAAFVDPGNHFFAQIVTYRGVITTGNPFNISAGGFRDSNSTSTTVTGVTTTVCNTRVVVAVSRDNDLDPGGGSFSSLVNANLTGITERVDDGTTQGNGGGFAVWDAGFAVPGATGDSTATGPSVRNAWVKLALQAPDATTLAINVPGGTASGHTMLATLSVRPSSVTITAPAGWTLVRETTQANDITMRMATYRRLAGGSEPASYTWTLSGAHTGVSGTISTFSGVDTGSPVDIDGGTASGGSAFTHTATGVTTTVTNTMVVTSHAFTTASTWTPPTGMTEAAETASLTPIQGAGMSQETNFVTQAAAGATGDKTATADSTAPADAGFGISHIVALRPGYAHYSVSYGTANYATCEPALVRIEAHDAAHVLTAPPNGTILAINTSTADGVWQSPLVTGTNANWAPSGLNNGVATYTWNGTENVIEVRLRRNTAGAVSLNLLDNHLTPKSEGAGEDLAVTFANSVLRVTADGSASANINTQIAGKRNSEGSGIQTLFVQAVATAPATGSCTTLFQNQSRNIEFAAVCNNPATCFDLDVNDAPLFEVFSGDGTGAAVNVGKNNNTATPASYSTVSLNFSNDANAMAPLVFRYGDAGQMTLHMRYTLPSPPATTIGGTSNAFVVRPFGIAIHGANTSTPIAHGSDHTGTILAAAGDPFTMTLAAYKWASALEDANANGVPDFASGDVVDITNNGLTPNFAADVSLSAISSIPTVALGEIRRGAGCLASTGTVSAGSWSGGSVTINDACYTEAGNAKIAVFATDYIVPSGGISVFGLSSFDGTGFTGGNVGRFRPKHFAVSAASLGHRAAAACAPASAFSYLDEPITLTFTLTAQNAQNATTQNYDGDYAKLVLTTFGNWSLGARSGTTNLTTRLDTGTAPTGSWSAGVASGVVLTTAVNRATPDNPDGPFTATAFGIAPVDADTVAMATPLDLDADNAGGPERKSLGALTNPEFRYGRLRMFNAAGPLNTPLPVPFRAEFWNGTAFAVNTGDSCTTVARNTVAMSFTPVSSLTACETAFTAGSATMASGLATLYLAAPGAGNTGSVLLTPQLYSPAAGTFCASVGGATAAAQNADRPYLTGRWNDAANPDSDANTSYDDNPSGRASFGVFGSQPNNYIYFRENY